VIELPDTCACEQQSADTVERHAVGMGTLTSNGPDT